MTTESYDVVIVGSGINSLVCAAQLAKAGRSVCMLERNAVAGGCIRTGEITLPGFRHDLFSMSYPLLVTTPHYPAMQPDLERAGLRMVTAPVPTAVALPDGRSLLFRQSRDANEAAFDALSPGDGAAYRRAMEEIEQNAELVFGLLGQEPRSAATVKTLGRALWRRRIGGMTQFGGDALLPVRAWLEQSFRSDLVRALIAPWILHVGLGPESTLSALMGKVILFTLEGVGIPFVEGGSDRLVQAYASVIEGRGGRIVCNADVSRVQVENGTAVGVETTDGRVFRASRAVVCNVTPTQLYGKLLPQTLVPDEVASRASRYAYGRADMQIHVALSEPPRWSDPALNDVALVHVTPGLDGVSRAVNEAERGLLPAEGTIVVGQPVATDPSRAPQGQSLLWIQLQELPRVIKGDAAGTIEVPPDGSWTDAVKSAYAERILARLRTHIPNLASATRGMAILSPADLEAHNINLVGGDPYSGACSIEQFHLFRPFPGARNHETFVKQLYHIGASTHPGPGLGGMSGHLVAQRLV